MKEISKRKQTVVRTVNWLCPTTFSPDIDCFLYLVIDNLGRFKKFYKWWALWRQALQLTFWLSEGNNFGLWLKTVVGDCENAWFSLIKATSLNFIFGIQNCTFFKEESVGVVRRNFSSVSPPYAVLHCYREYNSSFYLKFFSKELFCTMCTREETGILKLCLLTIRRILRKFYGYMGWLYFEVIDF